MSYVHDLENLRVDALLGTARPPLSAKVDNIQDLDGLRIRWERAEPVPVLLEDREQGAEHTWGQLDIRTLLRGEQSAGRFSAHSIVLVPGAGLSAHYHLDAHTCLLVAEGAVELRVGGLVEQVGKYSLGYVPPMTRMAFRNLSDTPATVIAVYSPAGADHAFAAAHAHWKSNPASDESAYRGILDGHGFRFDDAVLSNDVRTNKSDPPLDFEFTGGDGLEAMRREFARRAPVPRLVHTRPDEVTAPAMDLTLRKQLLTGDDSAGHGMMNLLSWIPGPGAPPHHQPTEEEFFFILSGALEMTCGTEVRVLEPGGFAFCPRNCSHGFNNPQADDYARFVTLNSPAGHERTMAALRKLSVTGPTPEQVREMSTSGGFTFHERIPGQ